MAVTKIPQSSSLIMEIENGTDSNGNATYKKKSFSNVKTDADPANVMDVAFALKGVLSVGIKDILMSETSMLVKEA